MSNAVVPATTKALRRALPSSNELFPSFKFTYSRTAGAPYYANTCVVDT